MNARRIWALVLRHLFTWRRRTPTLVEMVYWPLIDLVFFGLLATYFARRTDLPMLVGLLLGALILWHIFWWVAESISVSFLMEVWNKNLLNLFVTPLTIREFLAALMVVGVLKITVTTALVATGAWLLYRFDLFALGLPLVPFVAALLLFGWGIGTVVIAIVLRFGHSAQFLAWSVPFLFQPFGAVFFPMQVYPAWLQQVLWFFPLPHVFEGMRAVLQGRGFQAENVLWAFVLDVAFLVAAFAFFAAMFRSAQRRGTLLKVQE